MKALLLAIALAVPFAVHSPAAAVATVSGDPFTTYGQTLFSGEINHGPQVTLTSLFSAAITTDTQGRLLALNSLMGDPGKFVINDALTGEQLKCLPLGDKSAGSYATLVHSSGDIYLSSHPHGHLYRYHPGAEKLDDLGLVDPEVKVIWEMEEVGGGKIVMACYPKAKVIQYDPATSKFTDLGSAKDGEDYARAVGWYAPKNRLFVGVGSHPSLICWDLTTGEKKNMLPPVDAGESMVYNVDVIGDKVVTRLSPSIKGLVFDANTLAQYDTVDRMEGNDISRLGPDGESYYFTVGSQLMQHNLKTREKKQIGTIEGNTRGMGFSVVDGHSCVITDSWNGTLNIVGLDGNFSRRVEQDLPAEPIAVHNLVGGPDNRLYSSGYVAGALGVFDPTTSKTIQIDNVPQTEGASFMGNTMFFGTYPRARIVRYEVDPNKQVNEIGSDPRQNPKEIFRLESYHQDRPYGMLAIAETRQCVIGTIPDYGKLGGVICVYNDDDGTSQVHTDVLGKRAVVSLAYKDGIVYIGTTISGGLGIEPAEKEATVIGMDLKSGKKLFEFVPVKGMRIIGDLQVLADGRVWGWAEGTLFALDKDGEETPKVVKSIVVKKLPQFSGHLWRGALFTAARPDGKVYSIVSDGVFEVDPKSETVQKIGVARGFSTLVYNQGNGSLYFGRGSDLVEWKAR